MSYPIIVEESITIYGPSIDTSIEPKSWHLVKLQTIDPKDYYNGTLSLKSYIVFNSNSSLLVSTQFSELLGRQVVHVGVFNPTDNPITCKALSIRVETKWTLTYESDDPDENGWQEVKLDLSDSMQVQAVSFECPAWIYFSEFGAPTDVCIIEPSVLNEMEFLGGYVNGFGNCTLNLYPAFFDDVEKYVLSATWTGDITTAGIEKGAIITLFFRKKYQNSTTETRTWNGGL